MIIAFNSRKTMADVKNKFLDVFSSDELKFGAIILTREDESLDDFVDRLRRVNFSYEYTFVENSDNLKEYLREEKDAVVSYILNSKDFSELEEWNLYKRNFSKPSPITHKDIGDFINAGI